MSTGRALRWRMLALGSNGSGQLGIGDNEDVSTPTICEFDQDELAELPHHDKPQKIVAGGNHTLVLFESGAVFGSGENHDGRIGLSPDVRQTSSFRRVTFMSNVRQMSITTFHTVGATWESSFLIDQDGLVWICGTGERGELGLGPGVQRSEPGTHFMHISDEANTSTKVPSRLSCGMSHVILSKPGSDVWGWGTSRKGQLGAELKARKVVWGRTRLNLPIEEKHMILTGRDFTLILGADSGPLLLGENRYLRQEDLKETPSSVAAGWSTVYLLVSSLVHSVGRNDRGQFAPEDLPKIRMLAAGSEHCVAVDPSNNVLTWGWGEHGNCGMPTDKHGNVAGTYNTIPVGLRRQENILFVAAGCATTFIVVGHDHP